MTLRTGSLSRDLLAEDPELVALLLEDYVSGKRRDHCSRQDFAAGWLALAKRLGLHKASTRRKLGLRTVSEGQAEVVAQVA